MANIANLRPPWKPGESGNPVGRPARTKLTEQFVADVSDAWNRHGAKILDNMAQRDGRDFAHLCAKLIPANVVVDLQARTGALDDADMALLKAIKAEVVGANDMSPAEVFEHTRAALRAYGAKPVIEG